MNSQSTLLTSPPNARANDGRGFLTTRWTLVQRAKADGTEGRRALSELCEAYYEPVLTFFRCSLRDADAARDAAHDFFSAMLGGNRIANADREFGRFRSYLLGAAKHFLSHRRDARARLKRGGGVADLPLEGTDSGPVAAVADTNLLSPEEAYDLQWALTVVARALEALRRECTGAGQGDFFEQVKPWLTGESDRGDQTELAERLGMNATALKVAVHRLRSRFRRLLKGEIAGTLADPNLVEAEMRALFAALGGSRVINR
jgi:DNA-directed RNA polymerase specialized sigma24 family protein